MVPKVRELIVEWTGKFDRRGLQTFNREVDRGKKKASDTEGAVDKLTNAFTKFGITIGAAVIIGKIRQMTTEFIAMGDEVGKTAAQLGISTDELQAFRFAAESSGASSELMSNALAKLQLRMREATEGSAEAKKIFKDLGVDFKDAEGNLRPATDVFRDIADVIARVENPAIRTGLVMKAFEEEGRRLTPMLAAGSAGIEQMLRQFRELGGGLSQDAIRRSEELTDALTRMRVSGLSLTSVLATSFIPRMISAVDWLTRVAQWIREVTENSHILRATAIVLGATLTAVGIATAAAWGPAALTVGLVTAAVVLAALAIDDLWVTVEGGDSVLRDFIDNLLGVGATTEIIHNASQAWDDLVMVITKAAEAVQWFISLLPTDEQILRFTAITGAELPEIGPERQMAAEETLFGRTEALRRRQQAREPHLRRARQQQARREEEVAFQEIFGPAVTAEERQQTVMPPTVGEILGQTIARPTAITAPGQRAMLLERSLEMPGRPLMEAPAAAQVTQNIGDASITVNVTVQGGGDPEQAARAVRRVAHEVAREEQDTMLRQLDESLSRSWTRG